MQPVNEYELRAFFAYVVGVLERLQIPYMVVGGFAAVFHGEPRLTIDVDIIVDMRTHHVRSFVNAFPIPDYYVSAEGILDSLQRRYPFNVIQITTGAKIDLVPLPRDPFTFAAFQRRQCLAFDDQGNTATFITAEDIVIAKLFAYRDTQSDKHLRDAHGVLVTQWGKLNLDAIKNITRAAGMLEIFEQLLASAERGMSEE